MIESLDSWAQQGLRVGVGLVVGMLVGVERGFSLKSVADGQRVAGCRRSHCSGLAAGSPG